MIDIYLLHYRTLMKIKIIEAEIAVTLTGFETAL